MNVLLCRRCFQALRLRGEHAFFQCMCDEDVRVVPMGEVEHYGAYVVSVPVVAPPEVPGGMSWQGVCGEGNRSQANSDRSARFS